MPSYEYVCPKCSHEWEAIHRVDARLNEKCTFCGTKAKILISATARPVTYEYFSENLDAKITGPKQRREIMKRKNMEEV